MKKVFLYIFTVLLCISLSSCDGFEPARELSLLKEEYTEILQFFYPPTSEEASQTANLAENAKRAFPTLIRERHTELITSPYNKAVDTNAVSSVGITGKLTMFDSERVASDNDKLGYTVLSLGDNNSLDSIGGILEDSLITYNIQYKASTAPEGDVFAIEYAGFSCSDGYCFNPDVTVTLYVSAEKPAKYEKQGNNIVYITFDDGPSDKNTPKILDILDTYGVKAAFFTTGNAIEKYPEDARSVVERGHILACHSVTHDYKKIYASVSALENEVREWESIVEGAGISLDSIGQRMFRFPGGSVGSYFDSAQSAEMKKALENMGYMIYDWNVVTNDSILYMAPEDTRSYDYLSETFADTLQLCLNENSGKENAPIIILMHETVDETPDLLPWILEYLIENGYSFGDLRDIGSSWTFSDRN